MAITPLTLLILDELESLVDSMTKNIEDNKNRILSVVKELPRNVPVATIKQIEARQLDIAPEYITIMKLPAHRVIQTTKEIIGLENLYGIMVVADGIEPLNLLHPFTFLYNIQELTKLGDTSVDLIVYTKKLSIAESEVTNFENWLTPLLEDSEQYIVTKRIVSEDITIDKETLGTKSVNTLLNTTIDYTPSSSPISLDIPILVDTSFEFEGCICIIPITQMRSTGGLLLPYYSILRTEVNYDDDDINPIYHVFQHTTHNCKFPLLIEESDNDNADDDEEWLLSADYYDNYEVNRILSSYPSDEVCLGGSSKHFSNLHALQQYNAASAYCSDIAIIPSLEQAFINKSIEIWRTI